MGPPLNLEWKRPSPRLLRLRLAEVVAPGLAISGMSGYGAGLSGTAAGVSAALGGLALTSILGLWVVRRFRAWGYYERDDDLVVVRGVMIRRLSVIPYGRMQFVDVTAGPLERLAGLATVKLHTAAASSDARIPGLDPPEASRLRDQLALLGEAKAAGL